MLTKPDQWYEEFWFNLQEQDDDGYLAIRLLAELYADGVFYRNGDFLEPGAGPVETYLDPDEQHLIRRITKIVDEI